MNVLVQPNVAYMYRIDMYIVFCLFLHVYCVLFVFAENCEMGIIPHIPGITASPHKDPHNGPQTSGPTNSK